MAESIKDPLSSLLSNPAALSGIASLLSNMQAQKQPEGAFGNTAGTDSDGNPAQETQKDDGSVSAGGGFGGGIGGNGGVGGVGGVGGNGGIGGTSPMPDISSLLSAMSNPAMMSTISQLLPMLSTLMASQGPSASQSHGTGQAFGGGGLGYPRPVMPTDRRSALLLALKPYMPEDKQSAIDTVVRVIEIMSHIK